MFAFAAERLGGPVSPTAAAAAAAAAAWLLLSRLLVPPSAAQPSGGSRGRGGAGRELSRAPRPLALPLRLCRLDHRRSAALASRAPAFRRAQKAQLRLWRRQTLLRPANLPAAKREAARGLALCSTVICRRCDCPSSAAAFGNYYCEHQGKVFLVTSSPAHNSQCSSHGAFGCGPLPSFYSKLLSTRRVVDSLAGLRALPQNLVLLQNPSVRRVRGETTVFRAATTIPAQTETSAIPPMERVTHRLLLPQQVGPPPNPRRLPPQTPPCFQSPNLQ